MHKKLTCLNSSGRKSHDCNIIWVNSIYICIFSDKPDGSGNIKRTLFPIAQGIGKGGWALAALLLPPVIGRFLAWIAQYLPDIDLPDFTLPQIRLPHVDLPVPQLPQVRLPTPNIALPDLPDLPYWVAWLLEYSKIWVPVLIGIVIGVVALRNKKKSDAEKAKWEEQES